MRVVWSYENYFTHIFHDDLQQNNCPICGNQFGNTELWSTRDILSLSHLVISLQATCAYWLLVHFLVPCDGTVHDPSQNVFFVYFFWGFTQRHLFCQGRYHHCNYWIYTRTHKVHIFVYVCMYCKFRNFFTLLIFARFNFRCNLLFAVSRGRKYSLQ